MGQSRDKTPRGTVAEKESEREGTGYRESTEMQGNADYCATGSGSSFLVSWIAMKSRDLVKYNSDNIRAEDFSDKGKRW